MTSTGDEYLEEQQYHLQVLMLLVDPGKTISRPPLHDFIRLILGNLGLVHNILCLRIRNVTGLIQL